MFILLPLPTLSLIADLPAQAAQMRQHKEGFRLASSPEATFEFITTVDEGTREFTAPAAFNSVPDLLVLADYGPTDLASTYFDRMSRAIFDFSFQRQQVVVLPQKWFNAGGYDFPVFILNPMRDDIALQSRAHIPALQCVHYDDGCSAKSIFRPPAAGPVTPGCERVPCVREKASLRQAAE